MTCNPQKVIGVAESQIGYLEKRSNKDLDSMTGNAGSNNYTKYNRDMRAWAGSASLSDQWCQNFVDWCFVKAYGLQAAKELLGGFTNYTPAGSDYFKRRGLYTKRGKGKPAPGDVIYFFSTSKGRIGHVGIVKKVSGDRVYTIEGNTSGANSLVTNGGGVRAKSYPLSSTYIDGYGRPPYASVNPTTDGTTTHLQQELGDRILKNGMHGEDVKELQEALRKLGYDLGSWGCDGDFGDCTEQAVRQFQTQHGLVPDCHVGEKTIAALKAALEAHDAPVENPAYVEIRGGNCYVRETPEVEDGNIMGVAHNGSKYLYGGKQKDGWLAITYKDLAGWVSGKYGKLVK